MSEYSQNLDLRQSQNLVMTPQLQQAIKLLQLSNLELSEFLEAEMEQNPLLERDDSNPANDSDSDETPVVPEERDSMDDNFESAWDGERETLQSDFDAGSSMANIGAGGSLKFDNPENSLENTISSTETLRDHLISQLHMESDEPRDRLIGSMLIDLMDGAGYIREDSDALAERLGCSIERIENLRTTIKTFDPTGIGAKNLGECMALQLEERGAMSASMQAILDNLDLLGKHDIEALAKVTDLSRADLDDRLKIIRTLNPKPAGLFDNFTAQTAIPDVLMKRLPKNLGGGWRVELNNETLPRVLVNEEYYTEVLNHAGKDKESRQFMNNKMTAANWLVRAMDQRAQTILKVASVIVEEQDAFFTFGVEYLQPLTLKDVAEKIEMHESTVSRVTTNKYIGTPRGIFELKYFFSTALTNAAGHAHSAEAIKARIKNMVDAETIDTILSDDQIVKTLRSEGMDLARRTVAKYREALNIPSSVQRKKIKKSGM